MTTFTYEKDSGLYRAPELVTEAEIIDYATYLTSKRFQRGESLTDPKHVIRYLTLKYAGLEHEVFEAIFLDTKHRIIDIQHLFRGTIDGASVYPREVIKAALQANAAAVIFVHNHPSGNPEASRSDKAITERLTEALQMIEIRVLDHFIIAGTEFYSFAEHGLI